MAHEPLHALVLFLLLFSVKWAAINGEESTKRTIVCLEDFLDLFPPGFLFFEPVHPATVILFLEFQFVGDHLPCQFVSRHPESLGIRLGECVRSEQNDCHYKGCRVVYQPHNRWRRQCAARFEPAMHLVITPMRGTLRTARRFVSAAVGFLAISIMERAAPKSWSKSRTLPRQIHRSEGTVCLTHRVVPQGSLCNALDVGGVRKLGGERSLPVGRPSCFRRN